MQPADLVEGKWKILAKALLTNTRPFKLSTVAIPIAFGVFAAPRTAEHSPAHSCKGRKVVVTKRYGGVLSVRRRFENYAYKRAPWEEDE